MFPLRSLVRSPSFLLILVVFPGSYHSRHLTSHVHTSPVSSEGLSPAPLVPGGRDGERTAGLHHPPHQPRRVPAGHVSQQYPHDLTSLPGVLYPRMFPALKCQSKLPESTIETLGSSVVECLVDGSDIYPRVETFRLPNLPPLALVLQTEAEVPVGPGDAGGVGGVMSVLFAVKEDLVLGRHLSQPPPKQGQTRGQGHPVIDLILSYSYNDM